MRRTLRTALCAALAILGSCGGHLGDLRGPVGPVGPPPLLPPSAAPLAGLAALCAGNAEIRVDYVLPGTGFESALFMSLNRQTVFDGAPVVEGLAADPGDPDGIHGHVILTAADLPSLIQNDTMLFVGFGIRPTGATSYARVGVPLRCRPEELIFYVDVDAPPGGDGTSAANASNLLDNSLAFAGFMASVGFGSDPRPGADPTPRVLRLNVWIKQGTYTTRPIDPFGEGGTFALGPDVHAYGGFTGAFALADRDPTGTTVLRDGGLVTILDVSSGGPVHVLDGVVIDGLRENGTGNATEGIDVTESDCEFRSVRIHNCLDNGIRIRQQFDFLNRRRVIVSACDISQNGDDGVGVNGNFDVEFDRSTIDANGGAGIDVNDLFAIENATASFTALGCRFFGNSLEGIGIDLNVITTSNPNNPGRFVVAVDGCQFERNGLDGIFVDQDHDQFPAWHLSAVIRDCLARANGGAGFRFDADDQGDYLLDRVRATANGGAGLLVTSEPNDPGTQDDLAPGYLLVTNAFFGGNLGPAIRTAEGDKVVFASHCVFAGNQGGGYRAELTALRGDNPRRIGSAVSCILWKQLNPFENVINQNCAVVNQTSPFNSMPEYFAVATANTAGALTLTGVTGLVAGDAVEIGDDGQKLLVTEANGGALVVDPAPATFRAPDAVFGFLDATIASVQEDLRLRAGNAVEGTALTAPGDPAADPGPFGSIGGGQPGVFDPFRQPTLQVLQIDPPPPSGVGTTQPIVVTFDRELDPTSVLGRVVVAGAPGAQVDVTGTRVTVSPPPSGWSTDVLELLLGITSTSATGSAPLGTSLLVPILPL